MLEITGQFHFKKYIPLLLVKVVEKLQIVTYNTRVKTLMIKFFLNTFVNAYANIKRGLQLMFETEERNWVY